jgi:hypothetical protein
LRKLPEGVTGRFNDAPCVATIVDLLPKINHGSIVEAGLGWSFALRPLVRRCHTRTIGFGYAGDCHSSDIWGLLQGSDRSAQCHHGAQTSRACSGWRTHRVAHRVVRACVGLDTATFVSGGWVVIVELGALLLQLRQLMCDTPDPQMLQKCFRGSFGALDCEHYFPHSACTKRLVFLNRRILLCSLFSS